MPRDLPVGNGNIFISFDNEYRIREFCFPHIGEENHTQGEICRFGVWVDNKFSWIPDGWTIKKDYIDDALVTFVELTNPSLQLKIIAHDFVDFQENLYLKKITVENLAGREREVRLFFANDFYISGNNVGDTAEFRPETSGLLHYKKERYFLINGYANGKYGADQYATGNMKTGAYEGAWKDAEDGNLSQNPIAQGSVDSVLAIHLKIKGNSTGTAFYLTCCGKNWEEVKAIHDLIKKKGPEYFLIRTTNYWRLWGSKPPINPDLLPKKILRLYKRSLLIARSQINNCGSIIAGNDSDVLYFNRDTYSYMWPRDGALVAYAMDLAGYGFTTSFYNLCNKIIEKQGYFLHKYTPSGSLASSWHPWVNGKKEQLPIQEDETALIIWALWNHYEIFQDIEFIRPLYQTLIKKAADFMMNYRNSETGLPLPSYDLWEERQGILTFTVSAVFAGLMAAAKFTEAFGEHHLAEEYRQGALLMREAMDKYLYLKNENRFARMINFKADGTLEIDATIDASLYGIFAFGAYKPDDEKVKNTMEQIRNKLGSGGGLARYENDYYNRTNHSGTGNPWFITTLWMAQYYIALATDKETLNLALPIMEWVADRALPSGVLAEQIDPETNEPLSVSPLTWSHAAYITVVQEYLNKLLQIEKCPSCGQPKFSKTL